LEKIRKEGRLDSAQLYLMFNYIKIIRTI